MHFEFFFFFFTGYTFKVEKQKLEKWKLQNSLQIQHARKDFSTLTLSSRVEFDSLKWMTEINSVQNVFLTKKKKKIQLLEGGWAWNHPD